MRATGTPVSSAQEAFEQGYAAYRRNPAPMTDAQVIQLRALLAKEGV